MKWSGKKRKSEIQKHRREGEERGDTEDVGAVEGDGGLQE